MRGTHTFAMLVAVSATSLAQESIPQRTGPGGGPINTPSGKALFDAAGDRPNATNAVAFKFSHNGHEETLMWRVNVSSLALPDNLQDIGKPSAKYANDLHIVNTRSQLEWPDESKKTLQDFLKTYDVSNLYINFGAYNIPANLSSKASSVANGDCTGILGDQCTQSLKRQASENPPKFGSDGADGCQGTYGALFGIGVAFQVANLTYGQALDFNSSPSFQGDNKTVYRAAEGALQYMSISFQSNSTSTTRLASDTQAVVLCQIVNKQQVGQGSGGMNGSDGSKTSSAVTKQSGIAMSIYVVALLSFFSLAW